MWLWIEQIILVALSVVGLVGCDEHPACKQVARGLKDNTAHMENLTKMKKAL